MEAGSKMAAAMKDVINAAAGISAFAMESARDLVQYMVRRGQMTQEEADKLIREVEEAQASRKGARPAPSAEKQAVKTAAARPAAPKAAHKPTAKVAPKPAVATRKTKPPVAKSARKSARKPAAKPAAKKPTAKKHR